MEKPDPETINNETSENNETYIGNIWGWKFSIVALVVIVLMGLLLIFRYIKYGEENPSGQKIENVEQR